MSLTALCLRPNVAIEPLVVDWHAWSYILAPQTAGLYFRNYYLPIMASFVANPRSHAAALKTHGSIGGPFIGLCEDRVDDVKKAIERLTDEQQHLLELAEDIRALDRLLSSEADGGRLHELYGRVPQSLRGFVELFYDLQSRPSFRFIEASVYRTYYQDHGQGVVISPQDDSRPFVFNTPRLDGGGGVRLKLPFRSNIIDVLAATRTQPRSMEDIRSIMERVECSAGDWQRQLFCSSRPRRADREYVEQGLRVRYFGHACVLLQARGASILLDPLVPYRLDEDDGRLSYDDLPDLIDGVFITHNHQDHLMFETLLQVRHKTAAVYVPHTTGGLADISLRHLLNAVGFRKVVEVDEYETVEVGSLEVTGVPFFGEHCDLDIRSKLAYCVRYGDRSVMCVADSNCLEPKIYAHARSTLGAPDLLCLGMECDGAPLSWLYGPLLQRPLPRSADQSRRTESSNFEMARLMVDELEPRRVFVYAMGLEPWLRFITSVELDEKSRPVVESKRLIAHCRTRGIEAHRLFGRAETVLE